MEILFLGSIIRTEDCRHMGSSVAGNKMQLGLIKALYEYFGDNMTVLSEYPIASFPREKKIYVGIGTLKLTDKIFAYKIPFINIFVLKQITKIINALQFIFWWAMKNIDRPKLIICFNAFPDIALPALWVAKMMGIKTLCLLADLPIDVVKRGFISGIARRIEEASTKKNIKRFDALVVVNENAAVQYAPNSKYIVVDGGFDMEDICDAPCGGQWRNYTGEEPLRVVFSGAIVEYNGIINLIEAAKLVNNPNFRLELYGNGPLVEYVKESGVYDSRILYKGQVSNEDMIIIQQQVALLVNPRIVTHPVSMVTFPSKMIEYLLSGTPVVSTKLNGFTQEYLDHLFIFEDETPQTIANMIDDILTRDKDSLINKSIAARAFIQKNKSWNVQGKKIFNYMNQENSEKGIKRND